MRALIDGRDELKLTFDVRDGAESFSERLGFSRLSTHSSGRDSEADSTVPLR